MTKKKLTTEEILAQLRAQKAGQAGGEAAPAPAEEKSPAPEAPAAASAAAEKPAPAKPAAAKPAGGPKSTADILAAARAQAAGGEAAPAKPAAPKPAAAKPAGGAKSTADILAAARAQQGKAPAAEAGAPAAAAKPAAKAATVPAGDRPSVDEMLRKMREAKSGEVVPAPAATAVAVPPMPTRPAPAAKKAAPVAQPRRSFLFALVATPFAAAWTLFSVTSLAWLLALARFMMPNVLVEPPSKFKIGPPGDYPFGFVSTKWTSAFAVWVVHAEYAGKSLIYALSTVCTHLGCTPNWLEGEQKFKCPCHGSGFYITGINFEGPAPRPLERYGIRVAEDGMLEIDKSVKFQEEKGQWSDTASFVETV